MFINCQYDDRNDVTISLKEYLELKLKERELVELKDCISTSYNGAHDYFVNSQLIEKIEVISPDLYDVLETIKEEEKQKLKLADEFGG